MMNDLPRAKNILIAWKLGEDAGNFDKLANAIADAIHMWNNAARAFKIKPDDIDDGRYWELRDLQRFARDLDKMFKGTYVVTMPAKNIDG